jgi:type II secretory pathway component HofQ
MQIDLQPPMSITSVTQNSKALDFDRDGNVYYITLKKEVILEKDILLILC